jgi:hypothetical protein
MEDIPGGHLKPLRRIEEEKALRAVEMIYLPEAVRWVRSEECDNGAWCE